MKTLAFGVIGISLLCIGAVVFAQLNQTVGKRAPRLTNDDLTTSNPGPGGPPDSAALKPSKAGIEPVSGSIQWKYDLEQALADARQKNAIVVVDVYTDWCGWCKKMDQLIYADPRVVGLSRKHVFLKLDAEDGGQGEAFARKMGVTGYPTTFVLDQNGQKRDVAKGFLRSPENFIDFVQRAS